MKEGELFRCKPYLQINTVDGSHAMWFSSIRDYLDDMSCFNLQMKYMPKAFEMLRYGGEEK